MSAWEGSWWQEAMEAKANGIKAFEERIRRENPSLSSEDVHEVAKMEWARQHPPAPRCCPCTTGKAEWVRVGGALQKCGCGCHS